MDAATASAKYPGARPDPTSRTIRRVPLTEADAATHSSGQPAGGEGLEAPKG
jgi:hypothetical protein